MQSLAASAYPANQLSSAQGVLSLSEIISALTFALDLTEGSLPGHALRSCLLGMRLAAGLGLTAEQSTSLYYALLLKDCGCSSNASRMYHIVGGDDRAIKPAAKLFDWTRPHLPDLRTVKAFLTLTAPGEPLHRRAMRILRVVQHQHENNRIMLELRCNRGANIMRRMDMSAEAADAVLYLDEHWDGSGYPAGLRGEDIPLFARIANLAQNLDVFATEDGPNKAISVARARSKRWFDPVLVRIAETLHKNGTLWKQCDPNDLDSTRLAVLNLTPSYEAALPADKIDNICLAFADVIDAKSPFTARHSMGVADVAVAIATEMGWAPTRVQWIRRAALLHDIGKLRVPNSILEKPGRLDPTEREVIELHPGLTRSILERISTFQELAVVAGEHHEMLDGSGYPNKLTARDLCMESRLLAVADIFAALAEDRPYRKGFELSKCFEILEEKVPHKLDTRCYDALTAATAKWSGSMPDSSAVAPDGEGVCYWQPVPVGASA